MFEVKNLEIRTNDDYLLIDNLSFNINEGDKIAIIGEEGNGKSTLLKDLINKDVDYVSVNGKRLDNTCVIGYLPQFIDKKYLDMSVVDYLLCDEHLSICYDNYDLLDKSKTTFLKMGLNTKIAGYDRKLKDLSGGEVVQIEIFKLFMRHADIYLLDEPTNDLDLKAIEFLEEFIKSINTPVIFISHDEVLLENVANKIIHIEQVKKKTETRTTVFTGLYLDYIKARNKNIEVGETEALRKARILKKKKERLNKLLSKVEYQQNQCVRNPELGRLLKKKMHTLKSSGKRMENEYTSHVPVFEEPIDLFFDETIEIPKQKVIVDIHNLDIIRGNSILANAISLEVIGPKKNTIIGKNGVGKTTFLKYICQYLESVPNINVGYFPQNYEDVLDYSLTPVEYLMRNFIKKDEYLIRNHLGASRFKRSEMDSLIRDLSGGEKAKIILIDLILMKRNVLVLDEITRNFSPLSNPVIREMLNDFNGTVISVSHDRKYIVEVSDEIYELTEYFTAWKQLVYTLETL